MAPDLPAADDSAGFVEYADTVVQAIGHWRQLVLVAQSLGGFTAPLVCERVPVDLHGRDDRFFPLEFQRRVVRERLGITLDEMPGGHLLALSQPVELAARLEGYRTQSEADRLTDSLRV